MWQHVLLRAKISFLSLLFFGSSLFFISLLLIFAFIKKSKQSMIKKINSIAVALICSVSIFSCKPQAVIVNPGAVVSIDGTDDGLKNVKRDFEDATR
ncbi:MAG TPA: hypothetical protein DF610_08385, partial [Sphingobacterium sp.]|nr:hypothetical protein [Sphingobacterium sp.]